MNEKDKLRVEYLLQQFSSGKATASELQELTAILQQQQYDEEIQTLLEVIAGETNEPHAYSPGQLQQLFNQVLQQSKQQAGIPVLQQTGRTRKMYRMLAAACILVLIGAAYWFFVMEPSTGKPADPVVAVQQDVKAPASSRAMITLANGQKLYLDSAGNGTLAMQGNVTLVKNANAEIVYQAATGENGTTLQYNTLENPRGSKVISITLSDGSKVWLNAESSLRYPVLFAGNERRVQITGEAYFEITHDKTKPFYVTKSEMQVQVLGTHFNVNAYDDEEAIRVTLLEGSVRIETGKQENQQVILKPGQQAAYMSNTGKQEQVRVTSDIDRAQIIAWKNGYFHFIRADVQTVMRQLSRWYDVQVAYEGPVTQEIFGGKMERNLSLAQLLNVLQRIGVHYKINGKKLIITS